MRKLFIILFIVSCSFLVQSQINYSEPFVEYGIIDEILISGKAVKDNLLMLYGQESSAIDIYDGIANIYDFSNENIEFVT